MTKTKSEKSLLEIAVIPITIVLVTSIVTLYLSEQQRVSDEHQMKVELAAKYTEIFLENYKNISDPEIRQVLRTTAHTMKEYDLPGGSEFVILVNAKDKEDSEIKSIKNLLAADLGLNITSIANKIGYKSQRSYSGDCQNLEPAEQCIIFEDGYRWLINDSILKKETRTETGYDISISVGFHGIYYHILGTDLVKRDYSAQKYVPLQSSTDQQKENLPPVVRLTLSTSLPAVGETITLKASDSYDADGEIVEYIWNFGDGTIGNGEVVTHVYDKPGEYRILLELYDDDGDRSKIEPPIYVSGSNPPVAAIKIIPENPVVGEVVVLDGSNSYDPNGVINSYNWKIISNESFTSTNPTHDWVFKKSGHYIVQLTITDNDGNKDRDQLSVLVSEP